MEIVNNYEPAKFRMAIFGKDVELSSQIRNEFEGLWHHASANPPIAKRA